jgi:anti-sigma factor RsiW
MSGETGHLNCQQIVGLVTDYLEAGLSPAERLAFEQHVSFCPPCRGYLAQLRKIHRAAGSMREDDVPPELRDAIVGAFRDWAGRAR